MAQIETLKQRIIRDWLRKNWSRPLPTLPKDWGLGHDDKTIVFDYTRRYDEIKKGDEI